MYSKSKDNDNFRLVRTPYAYAWLELDLLKPLPEVIDEKPTRTVEEQLVIELSKFKNLSDGQKTKLLNQWERYSKKQKQMVLSGMRKLRK